MAKKIAAHQYFLSNPILWFRLLFQNRGVDLKYIPKALVITFISILSTPIQIVNALIVRYRISKLKPVEDPIFIIGHWRGGTTFLHYLMAKDHRFGYLTYFQGFCPNVFIVGGLLLKRLLIPLMPAKRPQDNMEVNMDLPYEEENPLAAFSMHSASHSFFFPRNETYYNKYILFDGINKKGKKGWKKAYKRMLNLIAIKNNGKQLLIKNPHNTGRMKELLEIYPNAKFINLSRNPYDIFPSTYLMYDKVVTTQFLHGMNKEAVQQKIMYYYNTIMKRYFKQKELIPQGQLIEIRYEDFVKDPMEHIDMIYQKFNMTLDDDSRTAMVKYVESLAGYKINKHQISDEIKSQIDREWAFAFDELNYPHQVYVS